MEKKQQQQRKRKQKTTTANEQTNKQTNNICFKNALLSKARLLTVPENVERDQEKVDF